MSDISDLRFTIFTLRFAIAFRELESNQRLLVQSQVSRPTATVPELFLLSFTIRGGGLEPHITGFKVRYPTVRRSPINQFRVSCGSRTHLSSLEGWHLCRSAKDTIVVKTRNLKFQISIEIPQAEGEGVEPSRHFCSSVFRTATVANRLALPNRHLVHSFGWCWPEHVRAGTRLFPPATNGPAPPAAPAGTQLSHHAPSGSGGARILVSWFSAKRYAVSATDPMF